MMRFLLFVALVLTACAAPAQKGLPSSAYLEDFDAAWIFIRDNYAYFDREQTDWERVRTHFRPQAERVRDHREFTTILEAMMRELYDAHAHLGVNTPSSPRLVPSGTDLWAEHQGGNAIVTDVRSGSGAERAGLRPGMQVIAIGGRPVKDALAEFLPVALRQPDVAPDDWALRQALAGRHNAPVRIEVQGASKVFEFTPGQVNRPQVPLTVKILDGNIGYIRFHDSLGDNALIGAWDAALAGIRNTRGMVLDLRDTPGGGNSTVARGILSRLVSELRPYQRHELPAEKRQFGVKRIWVEHVAPRGPFTYDKPVAALVGRWTGSMGEGLAVGLDGTKRATIVGTAMAGLRGATYSMKLPNSGIEVRVPAERLYHVNGTPRESFVPAVTVPPSAPGEDRVSVARQDVRF